MPLASLRLPIWFRFASTSFLLLLAVAKCPAGIVSPKSGDLYTGTERHVRTGEVHPISLEITMADAATHALTATMRNDSGSATGRMFDGVFASDSSSGPPTLTLRTTPARAIRGGGPVLDVSQGMELVFSPTDKGALRASAAGYEFTLERVTDAAAGKLKHTLLADAEALMTVTAADVVYEGSATRKNSNSPEPIRLRFTKQRSDGSDWEAVIESPTHSSWRRSVAGRTIDNRYLAGGWPFRLHLDLDTRVMMAPGSSLFNQPELNARLRIEGDDLVGDDQLYAYRLTRIGGDEETRLKADRDERIKQFRQAIAAGNSYAGVARDTSPVPAELRLRFTAADATARTVGVVFESSEQRGIAHEMEGAFDPESGNVTLHTSALRAINASGRLRVPLFSLQEPFTVQLHFNGSHLQGQIDQTGWVLDFDLNATTPVETGPEYPSTEGAYVRDDHGKWQQLPSSNFTVTYGPNEIARGITGVIETVSRHAEGLFAGPDKLADLNLTGTAPIPVVSGQRLTIVFKGPIKAVPDELLKAHPQLADYPVIECSPARSLANGDRQTDLVRIVPGVAGFNDRRIPAIVERIEPDLVLLTSKVMLPAGFYVILVHDQPFEVRVR